MILHASSWPSYKTGDSNLFYGNTTITDSVPNGFYNRVGNYIKQGNYTYILFNKFISSAGNSSSSSFNQGTIFGINLLNNHLYFNTNYHENYTTSTSDITSNWNTCDYFTYNNSNTYTVYALNPDTTYTWFEYPSQVYNGTQYRFGSRSWSYVSSSSNVIYYTKLHNLLGESFEYYYFDKQASSNASIWMLCYPYDLNGTGTPTTNENVLIEGSVPAQGATIETTDTITYTFNNDSVKPAIYDLSNKNMLVGRFADGRFTFGSQYEGDVVWTASTKQISIRRKQGWLTGSCNLWFQAADDQT